MPYVAVPAGRDTIARAVQRETLDDLGVVFFVPGLNDPAAKPYPDVMRGEEVVLLGLGLQTPATVVLPGTHSKWASVGTHRIERFQTFVTGEIRNLFLHHSNLAKVARRPPLPDWDAFMAGLALALDPTQHSLLTQLFSARAGWLSGAVAPEAICDYVTGMTIGAEFRAARDNGWHSPGDTVVIAGDLELEERYRRAAIASGVYPALAPADVAIRGALSLALA
jgi:2-dehydro-3-deoxygalactonokinase